MRRASRILTGAALTVLVSTAAFADETICDAKFQDCAVKIKSKAAGQGYTYTDKFDVYKTDCKHMHWIVKNTTTDKIDVTFAFSDPCPGSFRDDNDGCSATVTLEKKEKTEQHFRADDDATGRIPLSITISGPNGSSPADPDLQIDDISKRPPPPNTGLVNTILTAAPGNFAVFAVVAVLAAVSIAFALGWVIARPRRPTA